MVLRKKKKRHHYFTAEEREFIRQYSHMKAPDITSRDYRLFSKHGKQPLDWYEWANKAFGRFISISPDQKSTQRLEQAIRFTNLRVTPQSVTGLFVFSIFFFIVLGISLAVVGAVPAIFGLIVAFAGIPLGYVLFKYPENLVKQLRIEASAEVVLAVLYMVVSMRISTNLERALRFAAANISGALAWDLRRLLWDIELGKYYSASQAMDEYIEKWKQENEEFSEALRLIRDTQTQAPEKTDAILDEALNIILDGTKTRMKHYAQDLKLPVTVIHMMGIVLPILGSIMAPMAAVFLADLARPEHFIIGYDIILPIALVLFISNTLNKRPMTFSQVDIRNHPDVPKNGYFKIGKISFPILPVALLLVAIFFIPGILYFVQNPDLLTKGAAARDFSLTGLIMSMLFILGTAIGLAFYWILSTWQKGKIQGDIQQLEKELEVALFQLGNKVSGGTPIELAIEKMITEVKDLKIRGMFEIMLRNMRNLGLTFEDSLFHPQYGALRYYPSKLLRNIMLTVVDTSKKGLRYSSEGMIRISRYLKNIRETQEYIRDTLSETVSSMQFQAYFLSPVITGLIVSISEIIIQVLGRLGAYLENAGIGESIGVGNVASIFGNVQNSTSSEIFQLIIGIYLIEVIIILGMFLTKINYGNNKIIQWNTTGKMLIIGVIFYVLVALGSSFMFADLIKDALGTLGIV